MDRQLTGQHGSGDLGPPKDEVDGPCPDGPPDGDARRGIGEQLGPRRRPPYGRNPSLAAHGVRARAEIVEAARDLFVRCGYQATTVEAIGEATGRSGAAVYQYFSGKFQIFAIFLREIGVELRALGERFPLVTDDRAGRRALEDWLGQFIDLHERHAGIFLSWSQVQFTEPELGSMDQDDFQAYQTAVVDRLTRSGAHPPMPNIVPVCIMSVVEWSTFLNARRPEPVDRVALADALAGMLHPFLFAQDRIPQPGDREDPAVQPLPSIPLGDGMRLRRPVTQRGVGTVQRILQAAADRFRVNGYQGTSLNDVAVRAGVSHGSVYTYWADREALFGTLAAEVVGALEHQRQLLSGLTSIDGGIDRWVDGWVSMLDPHGSVLYVWQHEVDSSGLEVLTERRETALDGTVATLMALAPDAPGDPMPLRVALRAVLTDVPYVLSTQLGILPRSDSAGFVAGLLRAGLGLTRSGS
ncbi:MAG TPA: TetR/AcrR family transcriptional regulator [Nakamurella sp.]